MVSPLFTSPAAASGIDPRRSWQVLGLRGVVSVLFGILALAWPHLTVLALALLFGAYALVDGVGLLVDTARHRDRAHRTARLAGGMLGVLFGLVTLVWPGVTVLALALLAGVWAVMSGVAEVAAAIRLRKQIRGEALLAIAGIVSVIAGLVVIIEPATGVLAVAVILGVYALIFGGVLLALAVRLRRLT